MFTSYNLTYRTPLDIPCVDAAHDRLSANEVICALLVLIVVPLAGVVLAISWVHA